MTKVSSKVLLLIIALPVMSSLFFAAELKGSAIAIPKSLENGKAVRHSYFSSVSPRIIKLIEEGSPRSLKVAASLLRRSDEANYSEDEKALLMICRRISEVCWPSVAVSWKTPELSSSSYYARLLYSAQNGVFESPSYDDFISTIIPCLTVLTSKSASKDLLSKVDVSLSNARSLRPDSVVANYLSGVLNDRKGDFARAADYYEAAYNLDQTNKEVLFRGMRALVASGSYSLALERGLAYAAVNPQSVEAMEVCCDAYFSMGDYDNAADWAAKILMADSKRFKYLLVRAEIALVKSDFVKASSLLDAYSRNGSVSKLFYLLQARLQRDWNKNYSAAAATIGQALLLYPDDKDVLLSAAVIASEGNMVVAGSSASDFASKVLAKDGSCIQAMKIAITEFVRAERFTKAYELLQSKTALSAGDELASCRIDVCLALGKSAEARSIAKRIYDKNTADVDAQKSYLKVLVAAGEKAEAESVISALMPLADSSMKSFLYYEKSFLYGDESSVIQNLRSSLTLNPRNADSLYRLYQVYYGKQDWKRAQYYLKQVVALNPSNAKALAMSKELDSLIKNN